MRYGPRRMHTHRVGGVRPRWHAMVCAVSAVAGLALGCGDVSRLKTSLRFPDTDTASATRQLLFVVRPPPPPSAGNGCDALWGAQPGGETPEFSRLVDYPNRTDVMAAPLDVGRYTVIVYAFASPIDTLCGSDDDCATSSVGPSCRPLSPSQAGKSACVAGDAGPAAIAGGCQGGIVSAEGATELIVPLEKPPVAK